MVLVNTSVSNRTAVPLSLSSFKLEQTTLEIRYPMALALWDKAGSVWQVIQEKWPKIAIVHAEPAKTIFRFRKTTFIIELESARITTFAPEKSLDEFRNDGRQFIAAIVQELKIRLFNRVGFRSVYFREYASREEAAADFLSLDLLRVPDRKVFEVSDQAISPQYVVRWESEAKGFLLQVRGEARKLDFDPPPEVANEIEPIHREKNGITLDFDYYTAAPVEPAQIDSAEWVKHGIHLINRDTKYLFER
jgi:hypothetical protein